MNYDQLPKELKRKVDAALGSAPKGQKDRRGPSEAGIPLTCYSCREVIDRPSESALQRHQRAYPDHTRFEHRFAS